MSSAAARTPLGVNAKTPVSADELIHIATLKKPYGIKGWLWVFSETEEHDAIFKMSPWYMKTAAGFKPLTVTEWRTQGSGLVASFQQVPDRNVAETMHGTTVWVHRDNLPALADDEYYWSDLVGLSVINEAGECLGVVKNLFETGAHPIMTVVPSADSIDGEERLIPWHTQTVLSVSLKGVADHDGADAKGVITVAWEKDY